MVIKYNLMHTIPNIASQNNVEKRMYIVDVEIFTPFYQNRISITITFFIVVYMLSSILALSLPNKRYIFSPMQFACKAKNEVFDQPLCNTPFRFNSKLCGKSVGISKTAVRKNKSSKER